MVYNLLPALDDDYNFPVEVRVQLAKSDQLKYFVIPMSTIVRDNLANDEKWVGRTIYNTTTKRLETYQATGSWVGYLDDSYTFPTPPPLWDEEYNLPENVRVKLANGLEFRNLVIPMSEVDRNVLSAAARWDGRVIYNTTKKTLEAWDLAKNEWNPYHNSLYSPIVTDWLDFTPTLLTGNPIESNSIEATNYTAHGRYLVEGSYLIYFYDIVFTGNVSAPNAPYGILYLTTPPYALRQPVWLEQYSTYDSGLTFIENRGNIMVDLRSLPESYFESERTIRHGSSSLISQTVNEATTGWLHFTFYNDSYAVEKRIANYTDTNRAQLMFTSGCRLSGRIDYEIDPDGSL